MRGQNCYLSLILTTMFLKKQSVQLYKLGGRILACNIEKEKLLKRYDLIDLDITF
jgi:hypothetical protein